MGVYTDRVLPRVLNTSCGSKKLDPLRRRVCASLAGEVVEIGFGSGLNVPFYPAGIARVAAVEPSDVSWKLAGERLRATNVPVLRSGWTASPCPLQTTASTPHCPPGHCAPSPTSPPPWASCGESSSLGGPCIFSNTGWPPTSGCAAGNDASSRCRRRSPADAASLGQSSSC